MTRSAPRLTARSSWKSSVVAKRPNVGDLDLARWRLRTQHLVEPHRATAAEVVGALLAVQAENPAQSAWAVAARTAAPDAADLAGLLTDGTVVRTHVLRPTWHYVTADDVAWLIDLTAPRVRRTTQPQLRTVHGMSTRSVDRASGAVLDALEASELTRVDLAGILAGTGCEIPGHALSILLAELELQALICSGRPAADGEPHLRPVRRSNPVPATAGPQVRRSPNWRSDTSAGTGRRPWHDLAYWATLPLGDVRAGLAQASPRLESFEHEGRTFWHAPADPPATSGAPIGHLLQIFDEMYRGYQDSRWVLDAAGIVPRAREPAAGMAIVDAQLVAAMKRTVTIDHVDFEVRPYRALLAADMVALEAAASRYGRFLGRPGSVNV